MGEARLDAGAGLTGGASVENGEGGEGNDLHGTSAASFALREKPCPERML
jgi:hypothetical protein